MANWVKRSLCSSGRTVSEKSIFRVDRGVSIMLMSKEARGLEVKVCWWTGTREAESTDLMLSSDEPLKGVGLDG